MKFIVVSVKYNVELAALVQRQLKKLPQQIKKKILQDLENLNPPLPDSGSKKLKGIDDLYRLRVTDYRIYMKLNIASY